MSQQEVESRKIFITRISKGFAGLAVLMALPGNFIAKTKNRFSGIKVNVHPNAVKRNK
ncbi:MAG: hypothetical protein KKA84_01050 [Bacteroidetes bacterium]|nr:hypothetical protein [Bacteroidota bacterium]